MKKNICLCVNGKKTELTEEQLVQIRETLKPKTKLKEKEVGDLVKIGKREYIVLYHNEETNSTYLLTKDLIADNEMFGDTADFKESNVKKILDEFALELENEVGANNVIRHYVDLTSNDGLKDYGTVITKASLLTADLYRRFVYVIDKHNIDKWWWLATPYSTPIHANNTSSLCVLSLGSVNIHRCDFVSGVRPFIILNSDILVY